MKTTFLKFQKIFFLSLIAIAVSSCSDDGEDGKPGPTGTANVIYSEWMSFPATFTTTAYDGNPCYSYSFPAPDLTQEILDHGNVMVYIKNGNNIVFTTPYTFGNNYVIAPLMMLNNLQMITYQINGAAGFPIAATAQMRYVITPGGTAATEDTGKSAIPDYKNMSYEQVCTLLHIPM